MIRSAIFQNTKPVFISIILLFSFFAFSPLKSQDTIIFSDMSTQVGKVIEINLSTIKYTKSEIENGPIYEVKKEDILYIKYPSGYRDIFNRGELQILYGEERGKLDPMDSIDHAEVYIVFNQGYSDDQTFPLYFNGIKICTLRNRSKLKAIIYSEGLLKIERFSQKKHGPGALFLVENGVRYAIEIIINDPYGLDPNHRFHVKVYEDPAAVNHFIDSIYLPFEPDKSRDIIVVEDKEQPWILEGK